MCSVRNKSYLFLQCTKEGNFSLVGARRERCKVYQNSESIKSVS